MPGPPPKKNARRANARPEWKMLPSSGRTGEPPEYPLTEATDELRALWAELWSTPQAVMWESLGWVRVVARYAKFLIESEKSGALVSLLGEVRQLEDRLGLTPMAMKRLQWEIAPSEKQEKPADDGVPQLDDYRARAG